MIAFVSGTVEYIDETSAVISANGIGCRIYMSPANLSALTIGKEALIHTYLKVAEDVFALYGFLSQEALNMFKMIISVSGAGPKVGLAILSALTPSEFALAVVTGDFKTITRAQGVGPKLAQKILLELKDKLKNEDLLPTEKDTSVSNDIGVKSGGAEAIDALMVLGYTQSEAASAVSKTPKNLSVSDTIKEALKIIASR